MRIAARRCPGAAGTCASLAALFVCVSSVCRHGMYGSCARARSCASSSCNQATHVHHHWWSAPGSRLPTGMRIGSRARSLHMTPQLPQVMQHTPRCLPSLPCLPDVCAQSACAVRVPCVCRACAVRVPCVCRACAVRMSCVWFAGHSRRHGDAVPVATPCWFCRSVDSTPRFCVLPTECVDGMGCRLYPNCRGNGLQSN